MSKSLLVRMEIPINPHGFDESRFADTSITFHEWLPLESDQSIVVHDDQMTLTFWINMDCVMTVAGIDEEDIPRHQNIEVGKIFADVKVEDVSDELADFIARTDYYQRGPDQHTPEEKRLIPEYGQLGERVYRFTLERLNQLLSYVRGDKGQYWLENHPVDPEQMGGIFTRFKARVKVEETDWTPWEPTQLGGVFRVQMADTKRYIGKDDWQRIGEFVNASRRPELVGELLAGAEALAASGRRRGALTEAVTALEVAVSRFAKNPYANKEFGSQFAERLNLDSLQSQNARLGSTSTLSYLFPLIFTEDQMPTDVLKGCQAAIAQRQNVVHKGARDVAENKLSSHLSSIRRMCSILDKYSGEVQS